MVIPDTADILHLLGVEKCAAACYAVISTLSVLFDAACSNTSYASIRASKVKRCVIKGFGRILPFINDRSRSGVDVVSTSRVVKVMFRDHRVSRCNGAD